MTVAKQILIVEDEPLIAMMLEDFLDVLEQGVAGSVDTVAGALERVGQGGIDAAILDVNLRGGEKSTPIAEALADAQTPARSPISRTAATRASTSGSATGPCCRSRSRWTACARHSICSDRARARNLLALKGALAT